MGVSRKCFHHILVVLVLKTTSLTYSQTTLNIVYPDGDSCHANGTNTASFKEQITKGLVNGTHLSLLVALPLTFKGQAYLSPGFFQLASALMAIDHFNQRNSAIIPELANEELQNCPIQMDYETLRIFDTGSVESKAMERLMEQLYNNRPPKSTQLPHAIVGPYNEVPATELSIAASTLRIPMVTHRGLDHNLLMPNKHPFVTQVNPDLYSDMEFLGDYLLHTGRTDYIAILYASNADSAIQRLEVFKGVAHSKFGMKNVQSFGYVSPLTPVANSHHHLTQNVTTAMVNLKASGYRTIVWLTPWFDDEFFLVGQEAHKQELDQGHHFWVIGSAFEIDRRIDPEDEAFEAAYIWEEGAFGSSESEHQEWHEQHSHEGWESDEDFSSFDSEDFANMENPMEMMQQFFDSFTGLDFMNSAAFLRPAELIDVRDPDHSPFMKEWTSLNESFIERLEAFNPIDSKEYNDEWMENMIVGPMMGWTEMKDFPMGAFPPPELFAKPVPFVSSPPSGALHLYDAVMAVGIGACKAAAQMEEAKREVDSAGHKRRTQQEVADNQELHKNGTWSGELLQEGIRSAQFTGASGEVRFGDGFPGSRMGSTVTYHVVNMFPEGFISDLYVITEVRNATDGQWYQVKPFIYANGKTTPPELLRDPADQNYLSKGVRAIGLALMASALLAIFLSVLWVFLHRHHSLVVASQPPFLYFMSLGSAMTTLAILFLSFDESYGWSVDQLTQACRTYPWLVVGGHIVTYNSLFTKLWRVNRVLQFSRRQVKIVHVLWPAFLIESAAITLLAIWTATSDFGWVRDEIDETGESMGSCSGDKLWILWVPVGICVMIPTVLTGLMAWKTIDVDATYSEAKWICALMLVQCQVIFVAVPMLFILGDVSTDGRFLGSALILWTFPMTTMGLIMLPKMVAVHFPPDGEQNTQRGASRGVRVSGLSTSRSREDKSALTHSHLSHQSTVSGQPPVPRPSESAPSPLTQSQVSALTQDSNPRHSIVTQF